VEQILTEIWKFTLNLSEIAPGANFFTLGGDSLLAMVTLDQIKQRLGWKLNLGEFMRLPTIGELATSRPIPQLSNDERTIVRLSNRGARIPIVFIHPLAGLVFSYAKLVRWLGRDRGCYGLQSPVVVDSTMPDTVEGIADLYADLLCEEFGEDELQLVGWSSGGVIAFEIAKLAADKQLHLKRLVLIDSALPDDPAGEPSDGRILAEFQADLLAQIQQSSRPSEVGAAALPPADVFADLAAAIFGEHADQDAGAKNVAQLHRAYRSCAHALARYRPAPAPIAALLLHSSENRSVKLWQQMLGDQLTVASMSCDHYGLCRGEADAERIAEQISDYCA
jgi:thioesterase domain-containing protein/acyl carrier protein